MEKFVLAHRSDTIASFRAMIRRLRKDPRFSAAMKKHVINPTAVSDTECFYLTSNTTRVVQQQEISILISTKYIYIAELVQLLVLTAHIILQPFYAVGIRLEPL
jgi:hypothetical protein